MNIRIGLLGVVAAVAASSAALAEGRINIDINPFGWGAPPPVVYESPRYYAPPVVYSGRGHWGDRDHREVRGHDRDHHDDGDRRR
jgi:hypothetical protein